MIDKFLPDDARQFAKFLRERSDGHLSLRDIAIYGTPLQWLAIAEMLEANCPRASWCAPVVDDTSRGVLGR